MVIPNDGHNSFISIADILQLVNKTQVAEKLAEEVSS